MFTDGRRAMKTSMILLLTVLAVAAVAWVLVFGGSWLVCAGICTGIFALLMMGEKHEL